MKLIKNGKAYVEMKDLIFIGNLPNYVIDEIKNSKNGFEIFKNPKSIDYFLTRYEIINYNIVNGLEEEGIYDIIHALYEESFKIEVNNKKTLDINIRLEKYEYMVRSLKEYIDYRKIMDIKYNRVSKGELKCQTKKKLLKKD